MKWDAENYSRTCGRVTEHGTRLVETLKTIGCQKILDLGCGTGVLTNELAKFSDEIIGIDISAEMIAKAKALYPNLNFMVMDACSLIWENYFDAVFSNAVFHFIRSQELLLQNINRALKPSGVLICEFGASGNLKNLLDTMAHACLKRKKPYALRFFYPAEEEYRTLLAAAEFSVDTMEIYDLDTRLTEGEPGLRNWVNQIFGTEMSWFENGEKEEVLAEIESGMRPAWDGENWHLANKRIRVISHKI